MRASSGSIVAYGKFAALPRSAYSLSVETRRVMTSIPVFDNTLKKDDFPTLGSPGPLLAAVDCRDILKQTYDANL
jgi:hypothetical protein